MEDDDQYDDQYDDREAASHSNAEYATKDEDEDHNQEAASQSDSE
jgi:hypothetical protein